jgi:hypothetical protein
VEGSREHGNETTGSTKTENLLTILATLSFSSRIIFRGTSYL